MKWGKTIFRLARLGFFVGLGALSALVQACGTAEAKPSDAATGAKADAAQAGPDAGAPDASRSSWDVPLE